MSHAYGMMQDAWIYKTILTYRKKNTFYITLSKWDSYHLCMFYLSSTLYLNLLSDQIHKVILWAVILSLNFSIFCALFPCSFQKKCMRTFVRMQPTLWRWCQHSVTGWPREILTWCLWIHQGREFCSRCPSLVHTTLFVFVLRVWSLTAALELHYSLYYLQ